MITQVQWRWASQIATFCLALWCIGCQREDFPSRSVVRTDSNSPVLATRDMTPVDISLQQPDQTRVQPYMGETTLRIPKAYLQEPRHWQGQLVLGEVWLETALPDMRPLSIYGEELFKSMKQSHQQVLAEDVEAFKNAYHLGLMNDRLTIILRYGHCMAHTETQAERTPTEEGQESPSVTCPEQGGAFRRCKGITDYDALISMEYRFSISRVDDAKNIEQQARQFVETLILKNQANAHLPAGCPVRSRG